MRTRSIVFTIASLSLLSSCDHRVFDDLEDQVWVRADKEPSASPSDGFGVGLVSTGGSDSQLSYFIASKSPPVLYRVNIDQSGARSISDPESPQGQQISAAPFPTPVVMVADPGSFEGSERGNVAVSLLDGTEPMLYMLLGNSGAVGRQVDLTGTVAPTGIAFGDTDASPSVDLLAVSGVSLNLITNYQDPLLTSTSCELAAVGADVHVADVGTGAGEEVLIAAGGDVLVATGLAIQAAMADVTQPGCFELIPPAATIAAPSGEASFGTLIRHGDFDGNGSPDLVVAAPGENAVYAFLNWTIDAPTTGTKIATPSGASQFGTSISVGDFNGDGRDELVIADPDISVDSKASAGSVFMYEPNASGVFGEALVLHDANPEADQAFGQSLTIVQAFGGARLVVGAKNEVFTYFQTPVAGDSDFRN